MDALNSALEPVRPLLRSITVNLPKPIHDAAVSLLGTTCYKSLVLDLNIGSRNQECLKLAISKALGIVIITTSAIVKVPQLIKLVQSQSAQGLSFLSYLLETLGFVTTLGYSLRHGFPFSTFGENAFISIQNVIIAALILVYSGQSPMAAVFVAGVSAYFYAIAGQDGIVDMKNLGLLQVIAGQLGLVSKVPQIYTIWQEGSTGQLSAFAVFSYLFGSLSRIFTTLQEVDDKQILYGFIIGFALNIVLAGQMAYYWNSGTKGKRATKSKDRASVGSSTGVSGGSTRRRA